MILPLVTALCGLSVTLMLAQPGLAQCTPPTFCNFEGSPTSEPTSEFQTIDSGGDQTICVNACAQSQRCKSFSYELNAFNNEGRTTYCHLYEEAVESFGVMTGSSGLVFWNKDCYGPPKCPRGVKPDLFVLQSKSNNASVQGLFVQVAFNYYTPAQGNNLISDPNAATIFTINGISNLLDVSEPLRVAENFCPKAQENVFFSRPGFRDAITTGDCTTDRFHALTCTMNKKNRVVCDSSSKRRDRSFSYGCVDGPQEFSPNGWLLGGPKLLYNARKFCSEISLFAVTLFTD